MGFRNMQEKLETVFCFQNCSYLRGKNCFCDQEKLLKFEVEGREVAKILSLLE